MVLGSPKELANPNFEKRECTRLIAAICAIISTLYQLRTASTTTGTVCSVYCVVKDLLIVGVLQCMVQCFGA